MTNSRHATEMQAMIDAVLTSSGETDPTLRQAVAARASELGGYSTDMHADIPSELAPYITKVALHAYKVTDEDIEALRKNGYSEDAIFEITLSAALGAGLARLKSGLAVLGGNHSANQQA